MPVATSEALRVLQALYPSVPAAALTVYLENFIDNEDDAWAVVRQDPRYEAWFPGNLTDEGEVRYSETTYFAAREQYRDVFRSVNLPAGFFEDNITTLMSGEVSPDEFAARVDEVYNRVVSQSEQIQRFYSTNYGIGGLSTEALLAGALDPTVGDQIFSGQITAAEIGGGFATSGYRFTADQAEDYAARGMTGDEALELGQDAMTWLPILTTLAKRHNDPDDEFDIEEFINADYFKDPTQNYRMRRNLAQERSLFSRNAAFYRDRTGAMTGLVAQ